MILYFNKKSKIIRKWGILTGIMIVELYGLFIWGKIIKNNIKTLQITHSKIEVFQESRDVALKTKDNNPKPSSQEEYFFVASSRGKYYYSKNCHRAKSLSVKNMLYFKDKLSAEDSGYVAHSEC